MAEASAGGGRAGKHEGRESEVEASQGRMGVDATGCGEGWPRGCWVECQVERESRLRKTAPGTAWTDAGRSEHVGDCVEFLRQRSSADETDTKANP